MSGPAIAMAMFQKIRGEAAEIQHANCPVAGNDALSRNLAVNPAQAMKLIQQQVAAAPDPRPGTQAPAMRTATGTLTQEQRAAMGLEPPRPNMGPGTGIPPGSGGGMA